MNTNNSSKPVFAVLGAGHGGLAMAGHLSLMGFDVKLYNRSEERLWGVRSIGGVALEGEIEGFGKIATASNNIEEVIAGADIIMVVVPATAHQFIAEQCAPHLKAGQIVILNPGRTFGAIEFRQIITKLGVDEEVIVAEAQTFIYASRISGPAQVHVFRIKNSIPLASIRAYLIPKVIERLRIAYPQFVPGDNVFKTSFENIGAVFHPAICAMNAGWIEDNAEFEFYMEGVTESVGRVLEKIDKERVNVAEALGIRAISAKEWLFLAYGAHGQTLRDSMRANPGYRGIKAPNRLSIRYLTEDVPCSLVPIASIGHKFGVNTDTIDSIIRIASALNNTDYCENGRTIEKLQIQNLSLRELRLLAIGEKYEK
jgi:opine dehydrogenase